MEEKALQGVAIKPFNSSNTFTLPYRWHGLTREQYENGVHNLDCNQRRQAPHLSLVPARAPRANRGA